MNDVVSVTKSHARVLVIAVALVVVGVDALSKLWALGGLGSTQSVDIVDGILQLQLVHNPGAAFGLFQSGGIVLGIVAAVAIVWVVWYSAKVTRLATLIGLGFIAGGAFGNLLDRLFRYPGFLKGDVIDFIKLPHWPTFNMADVFVVAGVLLVLLTFPRGNESSSATVAGVESAERDDGRTDS